MFLWCCPWREKKPVPEIEQLLIEGQGSREQVLLGEQSVKERNKVGEDKRGVEDSEKMEKVSNDQTKSEPYDSKDKDMTSFEERFNKTESKPKGPNSGIAPNFTKTESFRPFSPRQRQKSTSAPKKSPLWKEQLKSDLIYIDPNTPNPVYMNYRLTKNQQPKDSQNGLDYFLSKTLQKFHIIIGKQSQLTSKITTLNKYAFNVITAVIVGQGGRGTQQNLGLVEAILMEDVRGLRWAGVTSVVVLADCFHSLGEVREYFNSVVKDLGWEELKKATFLFPAFMTLEQISQLLFSHMRQYVMNSTLQKVSLDLVFDMQLIEGTNLDCCIIIKTRSEQAKQSNSVYDHLKLSIVFFAKELSQLTQRIFIDFYIQSKEKSLKEYFQMKEFYRKNPSQFRVRVKKMKDLEPKIFTDLDNSPALKQFPCEDLGYYFVIPSKVREQIGRIYNIPQLQKQQIDTPIKKQWDDDATADDFKTAKTNKLDMVAKEELDQIDLDMGLGNLSDEEEHQNQHQNGNQGEGFYDNEIVLHVMETKGRGKVESEEQGRGQGGR